MARSPKGKHPQVNQVHDEPGAEERFKGILKRALNTPPVRKRKSVKHKSAARNKDKTR